MRIKGGPELRARLANIVASAAEMERAWATDAARNIKGDAPVRTGALKGSIQPGEKSGKGAVYGNWYGIILDRGTTAYTIRPRRASTLMYTYKGRTIFGKKSNRRRLRRRPFITRGAQDALNSQAMTGAIYKAWSRKTSSGRFSGLL